LAVVGAWWINFLASAAVGTLSLYMEQSIRVMDVWFLLYSLFSGYLIPVELFPGWIRPAIEWLPFRFIIDVPVQIMTGAVTVEEGAQLLLGQWTWVGVFLAVTLLLWKSGLKRFGAYGG
ncbi:MAG TPA: ABC-2 family transporter protein, partial [Myxococcaceae bacterium]|nr:ABC-2 family transporter protein [Myxococcaceae bacterium]